MKKSKGQKNLYDAIWLDTDKIHYEAVVEMPTIDGRTHRLHYHEGEDLVDGVISGEDMEEFYVKHTKLLHKSIADKLQHESKEK